MTTVRSEVQTSQFAGRRRSNTAQSVFRNATVASTPLRFGDSKSLTAWVHDPKESSTITFNPIWWPGSVEGDLLYVSHQRWEESRQGFLFLVPKDEGNIKHQLQVHFNIITILLVGWPSNQISIPRPTAEQFGMKNSGEIRLTKVILFSLESLYYCWPWDRLTLRTGVQIMSNSFSKINIWVAMKCGDSKATLSASAYTWNKTSPSLVS